LKYNVGMKLRISAFTFALALAIITLLPTAGFASTASLYVSPASGAVTVGSIIPVQIRVNSGTDPVNAIQANLTYNSAQLGYQSVDSTGSAFSLMANTQTAPGTIKLARATGGGETPVSGDNLFATVYFKALTTAGTASIAIAAGSAVVRSTDSVDIMAGAPAASGPKASATGAPTPKAYSTIAQAQTAVAASATPTPAASNNTARTVDPAATPTPAGGAVTQLLGNKVNGNNPLILGGAVLLLLFVAGIMYAVWHRRRQNFTPVNPATAPGTVVRPQPVEPSVHSDPAPSDGPVQPTVIQPTKPVDTTKSDSE
jgi:hypothetical protein